MAKKDEKPKMEELASEKYVGDLHVKPPDYTDEEVKYRGFLIHRLESAMREKETPYPEFDDRDYVTQYDSNARNAHSYLRPKTNPEDVRIVSGTTEEREITVLSTVLNYNFEPEFQPFDEKDMPVASLGQVAANLVKKSRKLEDYEDKRRLIYKELFDQGTCFVEEVWNERWGVEKNLGKLSMIDGVDPLKIDWKARLKKIHGKAESNLLSGKKVYLGSIRTFNMEDQPFVFTTDYMSYAEAEAVYGKWERWENIPRKVVKTVTDSEYNDHAYRDWTLQEVEQDLVEVIKYQDKWSNEYMIMLNGVMMLPIGFPLTFISPSGEYTIAKGDTEPISKWFAYSKSLPAKTKVDQAVRDEFLRLFILKTQQSAEPPYANNTNSVYSRRIFLPGKITPNVDVENFKPILGDRQLGINQSELALYGMLTDLINEKTASPVFSGDSSTGDTTATEIRQQQKQQMIKMGLAMLGVIQLEKYMSRLRLANILTHWTEKTDRRFDQFSQKVKDIYRTVSVEGTDDMGQNALQVIEMNPDMAKSMAPEQVMAEEDMLTEVQGRPVRKTYIDPKELAQTIEYTWFITITPTEKDTDELDRVLFGTTVREAYELFGMQAVNQDYAKRRFATVAKEDPNQFFNQGQPMPMMPPGGGQPGGGQPGAGGQAQRQMKQSAQPQGQPPLSQLMGR